MEAGVALLVELKEIVEKELAETKRRILERVGEVIVMELKEAQRNIEKKNMDFMISLTESIRRVKEESSKPVYAFIPAGKGDRKTFVEIIQQKRDEKKAIGELI